MLYRDRDEKNHGRYWGLPSLAHATRKPPHGGSGDRDDFDRFSDHVFIDGSSHGECQ